MNTRVLCFDLGASSGRAMLAGYDGERLTLKEVHRFKNRGVQVNGTLYWDILALYNELKIGLVKAFASLGEGDCISSAGIDTWGVDYGIIDSSGALISNPVQYRDRRTAGMLKASGELISPERLYSLTGNQLMEINTAFQLMADKKQRPYILENGAAMLNIPDLLAYMLTGELSSEMSIASTTQLFSPVTLDWIDEIETMGFPGRLFQRIVRAGESKGFLSDDICSELNIPKISITAVCGHDTQCASLAAPATEKSFVFLSSGTWSLLGTVVEKPVLNTQAYELGLSNEVGFDGKINILKNITGLWLVQETKAFLESRGKAYSFAELEALARSCDSFTAFIDPDAPEFGTSGDMSQRIADFCRRTGQTVPGSIAEVMRTIYISLAMKYRYALEQICLLTGNTYDRIYAVGGGTQDALLCQLTADVCGIPVSAGPVEATVMGNAAIQLLACGAIKNAADIPGIIASSEEIREYAPEKNYDEYYEAFKKILN